MVKVDLPEPDVPTIPTNAPFGISRLNPSRSRGDESFYLNLISLKLNAPSISGMDIFWLLSSVVSAG